jgi:hypothetical protein
MSLNPPRRAAMAADPATACNQDDATGFIHRNGVHRKVVGKVHAKKQ